MADSDIEKKFWRVFTRTLGVEAGPDNAAVGDLEEWDSLRHVELVFELEETFDVSVSPDEIAALYSDTDTIIAYLEARSA